MSLDKLSNAQASGLWLEQLTFMQEAQTERCKLVLVRAANKRLAGVQYLFR